jgi:hypothetical protein
MKIMSGKLLAGSLLLVASGAWQAAEAPAPGPKAQVTAVRQAPAIGTAWITSRGGTSEIPARTDAKLPGPGVYLTRPFSMVVAIPTAPDARMVIPVPNRLAADGVIEAPTATYIPLNR